MRSSLFLVMPGSGVDRQGEAAGGVGAARPRRRPGGRRAGWVLLGLLAGWAGGAEGQAFRVNGGGASAARFTSTVTAGGPGDVEGQVLRAEVTHTGTFDTAAVVGIAKPQGWYGYGGYFEGGWRGVQGVADLPGSGERYGLVGSGSNSNTLNHGVLGEAYAPSNVLAVAYGVYGFAGCLSAGACAKHAVYASGDLVYTGSLYKPSDLRFKESLAPLEEALGKLLALEVVSYEHVQDEAVAPMNLPEGPQVGFIAQQVAEVLPELVGEAVHPGGAPGDKRQELEPIRYQALRQIDLIPYLVRALQEQQAQIEALRAQLAPLQHRLAQTGSPVAAGAGAK